MKEIFAIIAVVLAFLALIFVLQEFDLITYQFFAPKYEAARREVFENTQSYCQGSIRDFDNLYLQYTQSKSDDEKAVLVDTLRHRVSGVQPACIPPRIRALLGQ